MDVNRYIDISANSFGGSVSSVVTSSAIFSAVGYLNVSHNLLAGAVRSNITNLSSLTYVGVLGERVVQEE